ncbi:MAG TPA: hypothetical protein VNB59_07300 [Solirubrobacterales bacterium]|nr:hypothetical protein [Solirubrobacterales bacterium]
MLPRQAASAPAAGDVDAGDLFALALFAPGELALGQDALMAQVTADQQRNINAAQIVG